MTKKARIWFNGELRESADCTVHIASHAIHYGSSVFEGIRAYDTPRGTMIMRGMDHLKRLNYSANVYRIPMNYAVEQLHDAMRETVRDSGLASAYIRPIISRVTSFGAAAPGTSTAPTTRSASSTYSSSACRVE